MDRVILAGVSGSCSVAGGCSLIKWIWDLLGALDSLAEGKRCPEPMGYITTLPRPSMNSNLALDVHGVLGIESAWTASRHEEPSSRYLERGSYIRRELLESQYGWSQTWNHPSHPIHLSQSPESSQSPARLIANGRYKYSKHRPSTSFSSPRPHAIVSQQPHSPQVSTRFTTNTHATYSHILHHPR